MLLANLLANKASSQEAADNRPITISPSNSADEDSDVIAILVSASVRIICPHDRRADEKTFMLHDVNVGKVKSVAQFRRELASHFGD